MTMHAFAFHKQFEAPIVGVERTFAQPYLLYASAGVFQLDVAERSWLLPPHRAALIAPGVPICIASDAPATSSSVLFAPHLLKRPALPCQVFQVSPLIVEMLAYATRWDSASAATDSAAIAFFQTLGNVVEEAAAHVDGLWFPRARTPELARALAFTLSTLADAPSFAAVAQAALVSERTLSRRFSAELGMGWSEFVQRARTVRAAERLSMSSASVAAIAYALGFPSASSFSQSFAHIMGQTPSQYRRSARTAGAR